MKKEINKTFILNLFILLFSLSLKGQELLFDKYLFYESNKSNFFCPYNNIDFKYIPNVTFDSIQKRIIVSNKIKSCYTLRKNVYKNDNKVEIIDSTFYSFNEKGLLNYFYINGSSPETKKEYFYNDSDLLTKVIINDSIEVKHIYNQKNYITNSFITCDKDTLETYKYFYDSVDRITRIEKDSVFLEYDFGVNKIIVKQNKNKIKEINLKDSYYRQYFGDSYSLWTLYELNGNIYKKSENFSMYNYKDGLLMKYVYFRDYTYEQMEIKYNKKNLVEQYKMSGYSRDCDSNIFFYYTYY